MFLIRKQLAFSYKLLTTQTTLITNTLKTIKQIQKCNENTSI